MLGYVKTFPVRPMYKIDRRGEGGGAKNRILGIYGGGGMGGQKIVK